MRKKIEDHYKEQLKDWKSVNPEHLKHIDLNDSTKRLFEQFNPIFTIWASKVPIEFTFEPEHFSFIIKANDTEFALAAHPQMPLVASIYSANGDCVYSTEFDPVLVEDMVIDLMAEFLQNYANVPLKELGVDKDHVNKEFNRQLNAKYNPKIEPFVSTTP